MIKRFASRSQLILRRMLSGNFFAARDYGLSDLLIYGKMIDDGVIIQTDGSFLSAFWFQGRDLETSTDEELAILSAQINQALNLMTSGWMIHVDTLRFSAKNYTNAKLNHFTDSASYLIEEERRQLYESSNKHYENSYVLSLTYKPKIDLGSKVGLFFQRQELPAQNINDFTSHLKHYKNKLVEITELLAVNLTIAKMRSSELLSYLSWCITTEKIELTLPKYHGAFLKHFLASKDLVGGEAPKIGDRYLRMVTIMGFPSESYPGILDRLNYLDCEYRWSMRFILLNQHEGNKIIDKIANLWYQKRISAIDTIKMSLAIDSNIKINQNATTQYTDAEAAKELNDAGDAKFGFYTATVILSDEKLETVEESAKQVRNIFLTLGFQSQVERYHSIEAYLGSLPGYAYANIRKWLIHSQNVADIMPNTAVWSGLNYNPCSLYTNNPPLFYAITNGYTPFRVSLHVDDNGHTLVLGPTGSGKSTLLNFIIAQHLRYQNAKVFVFDKGRSSLVLSRSCNGQFFDLGAEGNKTNFQPLAMLESEFDFEFVLNWLEELLLLNGLQNFNENHRAALKKALQLMMSETPVARRTLSYFRYLVQDYNRDVAEVLKGFCQEVSGSGGFIAKLFDADRDLLSLDKAKITVFEMAKLMEQGDRIIIPALRYLIHVMSKQFASGEPTLVVFDESFLFFHHQVFRQRIIEWIKTVRKFNVAIIFATSEIADLLRYEDLISTLKSNCATKIFLPNKSALNEGIYGHYRQMGLNEKQIKLIANSILGEYFYSSILGTRKFSLGIRQEDATFAFVAKTSQKDINAALKIENSDGEFAYKWLKYCNINEEKQDMWLNLQQQLLMAGHSELRPD